MLRCCSRLAPPLPLPPHCPPLHCAADGTGVVDPREILAGLARLHGDADEALRLCFSAFDVSGSGFLSPPDLLRMLTLNGIGSGGSSSAGDAKPAVVSGGASSTAPPGGPGVAGESDESRAARLADVFARMDTNRDRRVSFDEFKRALQTDAVVAEAILEPLRLMHSTTSAWK